MDAARISLSRLEHRWDGAAVGLYFSLNLVKKRNKNLRSLEIIHPVEKEIVSQGRFVPPWSGLHKPQSRVAVSRAFRDTLLSFRGMKCSGFNGMRFFPWFFR